MTIYRVIRNSDLNDLVDAVNIAISDGWVLQGGVCKDGAMKLQAMIKVEHE